VTQVLAFVVRDRTLLSVQPLKGRGNPVKCLAQGHNKRTF